MRLLTRFLSRRWKWLLYALLALAAYAALGFWLLPRVVASQVRDTLAERYHRDVLLGAVRFNPFTLELEAQSFALPDADGSSLLSFERLYVNLSIMTVLRAGLSFQEIALDQPRVRLVRRADGALNLSDLAAGSRSNPEPESGEAPPRLWIDALTIRAGKATIVDRHRSSPLSLELGPIAFQVRNFSTRSEGNEYTLSVESPRGETLRWRGDFRLAPLASRGKFSLQNIQVATIAEIAADSVPFQIRRGQLAATGSYAFTARDEEPSLLLDVTQLSLRDVGVSARGERDEIVLLPQLSVRGTHLDLGAQTVDVQHVLMEKLQVAVLRDQAGRLNLQQLWRSEPRAAPSAGEPWRIALPDIALRAADLRFEDRTQAAPAKLHFAPVELAITGFASPLDKPVDIDLRAGVEDDGQFAARGQLDLQTLAARFAIDATALPLPPVQPYLADVARVNLTSGAAHFKGTLTYAQAGPITFAGEAGVDELATTDTEEEEAFVKWRSLRLTGLSLSTEPPALRIDEIAVSEPYARVIIFKNGDTNIRAVLSSEAAAGSGSRAVAADSPPAAPAAPDGARAATATLPVEIGSVRVDGGSMNFADRSIAPNFDIGIQKLSGTIKGLSARSDARADVRLAGEVDRYTPVKISGKVNYFAAVSYTDLRMVFRNLELTSLSPYSGKFAGYRIERGKLNLDLNYLIKKRRLDAKHKIIVDQLQLGDHVDSPDATSLPVKLAIALLKDKNGVIDLDIPVSGNLDDPKFKVWPIIWQVVVNLLTKIVTSPFALLGSLFGAGEEISYVEFAAGSAELSPAAVEKLKTLAKALDARPSLNLDVPLLVKPDVDRAALLSQRWQAERDRLAKRRLGVQAKDQSVVARLLATPKDYRALLETAYQEAFGRKPQIPAKSRAPAPSIADSDAIAWLEQQLKARTTIGQSDLDALAKARAQAVQASILDGTGIDPSRVFVIAAPALPNDSPLRMQLALH